MKPSETLESAANIILRDGWWQGSYFKIPPVTVDTAAQAAKWMRRYTEVNFEERSPIAWNDAPERTKEDVVAALRGAAEMAREAGE